MIGKMIIEALKVPALIGVDDSEKTRKQILSVDLCFSIDLTHTTKNDLISDTIDYTKIRSAILNFASSAHVNLLETFSKKLFDHLHEKFKLIDLKLSVTKFPTSMPDVSGVKITL